MEETKEPKILYGATRPEERVGVKKSPEAGFKINRIEVISSRKKKHPARKSLLWRGCVKTVGNLHKNKQMFQ
ncbi:MAG: hypothetical protein HYV28_11680 [Ignavibacteriales bacterium]|nr:hypothetical protein [Ignavibacteriales bacterium]